jgi:hypothetical protein
VISGEPAADTADTADTAAAAAPETSLHEPGEPIAAALLRVTRSMPAPLQPLAAALPHRLGLTRSPDGGFEDFVILNPNRELPIYADDPPLVGPERLRRFLFAHHVGGFYWLLRDRLADKQVRPDPPLLEVRRHLFARWYGALDAATEDPALSREVIDEATDRWCRAVRAERAALRAGAGGTRPSCYAVIVTDKLRWISAAAEALLVGARQRQRARLFQRSYDLFLLALQCIDDVNDQDEDRALHGHSVPVALGCSAGALLRTAPKLAARAAAVAAEGRFGRLASWLDTFAGAIPCGRSSDGDPIADELAAIALAAEMEGEPS